MVGGVPIENNNNEKYNEKKEQVIINHPLEIKSLTTNEYRTSIKS